ncbi:conserved hypothetical protein [Leishmania major strain Friedlin]|uniref:Uncharacterized protein n=1 Tax=Leishmania major TaxID=5664 RepID=Q4Q6X4_LEIMA|nr:conserved hypothetical protein [Leishmania major strain Friedlin]CAG9578555.1 hypothetical_protein_-_conserved [Leishmania major strain Friedlin]CAJ06743.1 conserved hypothetical protein [Leishmania major strain Friedlin]|eukprot:XP_001684924.1 conserved hypothetical protein [Leishmania major strain Friedlin]
MRGQERIWKAAPLPQAFHAALESGNWLRALQLYQRHPYHTPPADTFDLLKAIMHYTGVGIEDVKVRFNEKMRLSASLQRRKSEEVEWSLFWEALNKGDGKMISEALSGASVSGATQQIGMAEACAVLLKGAGKEWHTRIVDDLPFSTVTRCSLLHAALAEKRPDVAAEMLSHARVTRSDLSSLWPLMAKCTWEEVLRMISACPKNAVPYNQALPFILKQGCSLQTLSEHLEHARVLGDADVVAPLLAYAVEMEDWPYVERCVGHLVDIGKITPSAREAFGHLCKLHGPKRVCHRLMEHHVELSSMTIEDLESLRF